VLLGLLSGVRGNMRALERARAKSHFGKFADPHLTRLARAIDRRDVARLRELLAEPTDYRARDRCDHTILGHAVMRVLETYEPDAGVECVRVLLAAGAPPDRRVLASERTSYAPEDYELIAAVFGGNSPGTVALLDALLAAGADPDVDDMHGEPIIFSSYATVPKLEVLAAHGADLDRVQTRSDRAGWTAIMNAAGMEMWDEALFFLEHGARTDIVAPDGCSLRSLLAEWAQRERTGGAEPDSCFGYRKLVSALDSAGQVR
jgi:hypothetical protein